MSQSYVVPRLFDGEQFLSDAWLTVSAGQVVGLGQGKAPVDSQRLEGTLVPGFIDVQVNGGGGVLFNAQPSVDALKTLIDAHRRFGSTGLMATLITDDLATLQRAADAIAQARSEQLPGLLGVHFEGPHLSVAKKGVHSAEHIRPLSEAEMAQFLRQDLGKVMVTLAPENVSREQIARLVAAGVRVCLGHSNADFDTARAALAAGASGFTHLFNAMSPFTSREPGMVGAALLDEQAWCGLIVDGHHVHNASLQLALKVRPVDRMLLVTDAMPPVGVPGESFELMGRPIRRQGDKLTAPTGELAGSVLDMASAVRASIATLGLEEGRALNMASRFPAEFLGLSEHGHLRPGSPADMVLLDEQQQVKQSWIGGSATFN
ncbi:N-acetylglucosamine-6-phosphate deacetylase [Ferrimonas marina]|uniref:N-acetylgalactosamine-6-phosphate deacetylase n=1 Tax=Ferrimonas marina TaxID=299255 RepID=A0A1M5YCP8_9GAMM|nr:N-acetylglucosamine-6-phosphate deacetylase [Ferrimonas marina]SHI09679.1 N-acetylglucosamine-6-phosphate deacetylase [Ferrimonas marina]